ncbi:MAG: protein translocase subunit SecD [Kordiimonadaceae bacterium]|jgi:preprotein translocase subunit SecD|nr:protein translocase subunit SecD [Kordiimonadaceae bacterium]
MLDFPRWKVLTIIIVSFLGILMAMPNFLTDNQIDDLPGFLPSSRVTLGLDLQGGAHFLLEVDTNETIAKMLLDKGQRIRDDLRDDSIRHRYRIISQGLLVTLTNPEDRENALQVIRESIVKVGASLTDVGTEDIIIEDGEGSIINISLSEAAVIEKKAQSVQQSIEVLRRRIDEDGTKELTIQQNGEDRILLQIPGIESTEEVKAKINTAAAMNFHLTNTSVSQDDILRGRMPPRTTVYPSIEKDEAGNPVFQLAIRDEVMVSGEDLVNAMPERDQDNGSAVGITFNSKGGKQFADATRANVGKPFAIILDGEIISAPRINTPILGGSAIITGSFTVQETNDLSLLLRAGALPAPLRIVEERTVGPDLGADSVAAGQIAAVIGLLAVMVFITLSYGFFGFIANFALGINILMIFGVLSLFGATLTLPGIAGIVLTVGMAVDANVLIFERIREEMRRGKKVLASIDVGYSRAVGTIFDANVTTLIAALILFQFGSGPVKGFAVTLAAGIITSVFTAVSLSRLIIVTWARKKRPATLKL